jgi:alpha-1,3/alpha-1,6-mannosyltransferase
LILKNTSVLLYTPENEHFGIVPVEAMHLGCIVIACNSGGPLESVHDKHTGYLLPPSPALWAGKINSILEDKLDPLPDDETMLLKQTRKMTVSQMKEQAMRRVQTHFSADAFADNLIGVIKDMGRVGGPFGVKAE